MSAFRKINSQFSSGINQNWYLSNGIDPSGALSANVGDVCFVAATGSGTIQISNGGSTWANVSDGGVPAFPLEATTDGTSTVPAYTFSSDTDTGLYRNTLGNTLGFAAGGIEAAQISTQGILAMTGTVSQPSIAFIGDPDTGIAHHQSTDNALIVVAGSGQVASFDTNGLNMANDGTAADPVIALGGEANTGLYTPMTAVVGVAAGGVNSAEFSASGINTNRFLATSNGTNNTPAYTFSSNTGSGMYVAAANGALEFSASGTTAMIMANTAIESLVPIGAFDGSVTNPAYTFILDSNTGLYRVANDVLGVAAGGTGTFRVTMTGAQISRGSATNPSLMFIDATDTGLFYGVPDLAVTVGGSQIASFYVNGILNNVVGSAGVPSYSFNGATTSGMFLSGPSGNRTIGVGANGSEGLRVTSTGVRVKDGTISAPSIAFQSTPTLGFYLDSSTTVGVAGRLSATGGTVDLPAITLGDDNTGLYRENANNIGIVANATKGILLDANGRCSIGKGTNANQSATLEVSANFAGSNYGGLLIPTITTANRDTINSGAPAGGLHVFNTTTDTPQWYNNDNSNGATGWRDYTWGKTRYVADASATMDSWNYLLYWDNTTGTQHTLTLPSGPQDGQEHYIRVETPGSNGTDLLNGNGKQLRVIGTNASLSSFTMATGAAYHYIYCQDVDHWVQVGPALP